MAILEVRGRGRSSVQTGVFWAAGLLLPALAAGASADLPLPQGESPDLPEYVLKAGFLFNFAKYVEWPPDAFEKADSPIAIGIVGTEPFGGELDRTLRNKMVKERGFVITRYRDLTDLKSCHILFVPRSESSRTPEILKKAESWPALTVGEDEGFAKAGGAVGILIENKKPHLEINPLAAEKARLKINSKLLKVATIVRSTR